MEPKSFLGLLADTRAESAVTAHGPATPTYCRMRLLTVTTVEAATAVVARAVALEGRSLRHVADAWAARTPNPVTRARQRERGRDLLELSGLAAQPLPRAVAIGALAADAGISAEDLARMVGYDDVQAVLSGADPAQAHAWTAALVADVREMAAQVAHLVDPDAIPATGADLSVLAACV
jgi:urease accessory protein